MYQNLLRTVRDSMWFLQKSVVLAFVIRIKIETTVYCEVTLFQRLRWGLHEYHYSRSRLICAVVTDTLRISSYAELE